MCRDLPCLAAHIAVVVLLSQVVFWVFMWRRSQRRLARAREVIATQHAALGADNAGDPFND